MTGKDNCTTAAHGGTMFDDRQTIQRRCRQHTAAQSSLAPRASGADLYAWMSGFRAKLSPGSDLIRAAAGKDGPYSGEKEDIQTKNGGVSGCTTEQKPLCLRALRLTWATSGRKTADKSRRRV